MSLVFKPNCSRIAVDEDITVPKSSPEALAASNTEGMAPTVWLKSYPRFIISSIPSLMEEVSIPYCCAHFFDLSAKVSICFERVVAGVPSERRARISVICPLKFVAAWTPFANAAVIPTVTGVVLAATESRPLLTLPKPEEIFGRIEVCLYCSTAALFN